MSDARLTRGSGHEVKKKIFRSRCLCLGFGLFWIFTHLGFGFDSIYFFSPENSLFGCWLLVVGYDFS